jgi:hypothetical protein
MQSVMYLNIRIPLTAMVHAYGACEANNAVFTTAFGSIYLHDSFAFIDHQRVSLAPR